MNRPFFNKIASALIDVEIASGDITMIRQKIFKDVILIGVTDGKQVKRIIAILLEIGVKRAFIVPYIPKHTDKLDDFPCALKIVNPYDSKLYIGSLKNN